MLPLPLHWFLGVLVRVSAFALGGRRAPLPYLLQFLKEDAVGPFDFGIPLLL